MAIPIKPISGLRQAAKEMNRYSEARAMLADFVKAVEPVSAYNTMRAADASMEGETLSKFPSIVQACMKVHLTFVLELSMKPILLSTMMNMEALFNSEWFKDVAMKMKRVLDESASDTLVVFRMKTTAFTSRTTLRCRRRRQLESCFRRLQPVFRQFKYCRWSILRATTKR